MAFDAGMVSAIVHELNERILDARVEKVTQPERDELVLLLHAGRENLRLVLSAGSNNPRFHITSAVKENPPAAPMFCMLLRKHLTGARLIGVTQLGFERAVEFAFDGFDEMGYKSKKYLIAETMGKYSNIIFLNEEKKVVSALRIIDLASSFRQILPGFPYELPPEQKKRNPLMTDAEGFRAALAEAGDVTAEKFLLGGFYGFSSLTIREIVCRADAGSRSVRDCDAKALETAFFTVTGLIREGKFEPWLVCDLSGKAIEYSFFEPLEYGAQYEIRRVESFGVLLDEYFGRRDRAERIKQRTSDLFRILSNAETRLRRKIEMQTRDLEACADKEQYKLWGDLITANIYRLQRGMESAVLENYYSEECEAVEIPLDKRLAPQQNAQRYYKKYAKAKTAEVELARQIKLAEAELEYIYTVFDSLTRAEAESDIAEIRDELYRSGYASKMKNYTAKKLSAPKLMEFRSTDGARILCGKNNHQNDYLTTKAADKTDYWFHVKNQPGSHCVLITDGKEPTDRDFTEAAMIAAYYSKASEGVQVPVDYTQIKNVRKPGGAKPGFVIYNTNYTAYVTPDERHVLSLKVK